MPKYLFAVSYTAEGAKGLLKEGGSSRRAMVDKMVADAGGSVECMYYAFGETDAYLIAELPDVVSVTAMSLTVSSSGAVVVKTVPLISVEEVDEAARKSVDYQPPGG